MTTTLFGRIQAAIGGVTFGEIDANGVEWHMTDLAGWGSVASTLQLTQKPRGPGAFRSVPAFFTPRTLAPAGSVFAPSFDAASAAWDQLCAAFPLDPTVLSVTEGSRTRTMSVQRAGETLVTWLTDTTFQWSAQLSAADPRKMATALTTSTGLPSSTGGLTIPFTIPFTIASTVVSGQCSLINPGNTPGPLTLRIDGPIVGPVITHVSTGLALTFASSLTLNTGEFLLIDMEAQTALANGQSSRNGYITSRGWFGFDPGVNQFSFTAVSGSGQLTVTGTPAWQ